LSRRWGPRERSVRRVLTVAGVVGAVDRAGHKWAAAMVIKEAANRGGLL